MAPGRRRPTAALLEWISRTAATARRTASVCTGAFLLAAAGLLDGRRATTHWASAAELAARYPAVEVDPEPIFLRDGPIWTSAGVTAGMDLALALVEEDLDREAALTIARHLVLFLRRPGNQSQFSATLSAQEPAREPLREVQRHVVEHPAADLSVEALADARLHEPAPLRPRVRGRDRGHARALRRAGAPRGRPPAPGGHRGADRGRRRGLRLRHRGDDAPRVPARARRRTRRSIAAASTAALHRSIDRRRLATNPTTDQRQSTAIEGDNMDIAILMFDRLAALDAVGPYEVLSRLPGAKVTFVAEEAGPEAHRHRPAGADGRRRRSRSWRTPRSCSSPAAPARRR